MGAGPRPERVAEEISKILGVELTRASDIQIEIPGSGIQTGIDELLYRIVLLIFVLAPDVISAVE